jgi:hypothetical protein
MWRRVAKARKSRATVALGAGLVLLAIALAIVLSGSPLVVIRANATPADEPILRATGNSGACQDGEALPAGVSAIRLILVAVVGPQVGVTVTAGSRPLAAGSTGSGWTAGAVTVPVKPLSHATPGARICFKLGRSAEGVEVGGSKASAAVAARSLDGRPLPGRFTVEYLHRGSSSWWSSAKAVSRRLGLGHAPAGSWIALLLIVAMGGVVATASWLVTRELG